MKKLFGLFAVLLLAVGVTSCGGGEILEDVTKDFYATGAHANWGEATANENFKMEAVALNDSRIRSVRDELAGATSVYIFEVTLQENQEWTADYKINGVDQKFNGGLTVKVIRTDAGDDIPLWHPSPESGAVANITPETMYMPPYRDESLNTDGAGFNNSNPVALKAGTYYLVFAVLADNKKVMGLVTK